MNTMYLVCVHHPDKAEAFLLANRSVIGPRMRPYVPWDESADGLYDFLILHAHCGGGFDHFTIAYDQTKDHDLPKPAPLADGVHLALREAANSDGP